MKKRKFIINLFAAVALLVGCNESLEDTYSDYAGDGKIRYVAKCSDIKTTAGWKRLIVDWVNGNDATIDKIKVVWSCEDRRDSVLLPKESTSYELKDLTDGTYRFDVCAMNALGQESLKETIYARPFTENHEIMLAFTRGILKSYFLGDKMLFFSDLWNEDIVTLVMYYTKKNGEEGKYEFTKEKADQLCEIDGIDTSKPVYVVRKGKPVGCPDIIDFEDYKLSSNKNFTAGFVHAIERRYGYTRDTKAEEERFDQFINEVEELEFDYDIDSFEDVIYCPNLKKIVLCKNRFIHNNPRYNLESDLSRITSDERRSLLILEKAQDPDILGLKIEFWGNEWQLGYFDPERYPEELEIDFMDYPVLDERIKIVDQEELREYSNKARVLCEPSDIYGDLDLNKLLDDDNETWWTTTSKSDRMRTYELLMEFIKPTMIDGVKVSQTLFNPKADTKTPPFMPRTISAQTSMDGANWENITFFEVNDLGWGTGETTLLKMVDHTTLKETPREVRYLRFTVKDGIDRGGNSMISVGDIVPYRLEK